MQPSRDLLSLVLGLARLIRTQADKRARAHGMSRAQWAVLLHLRRRPGLVQKELAELLEVEPITAGRILDRLQARGMIERRADPADRRCWRLHLTAPAEPLLEEIEAALDELAAFAAAGLSAAQQQGASDVLEHMRQTLLRAREPAPAAPAIPSATTPTQAAAAAAEHGHSGS